MKASGELHQESLLGFDGTRYRFGGGYEISLDIAQVDRSPEFPHGFRYSFVLLGPPGRILGYDNAHAPWDVKRPYDHVHKTKRGPGGAPAAVDKGSAVSVRTIDELIGTFLDECYRELSALGVDLDSVAHVSAAVRDGAHRTRVGSLPRKGGRK